MKTLAKIALVSLVSVAFLGGCAKKCGEPVMQHKLHKVKHQAGGK